MHNLIKIVIIGPESTGKSTLCSLLAKHYNTIWCPEYAREYLLQHGTSYQYQDLQTIAAGQLALEDIKAAEAQSISRQPLLFIDTDMYVMKVWYEYVFGKCPPHILEQIAIRPYQLYLLCKPDVQWIKDELREYPDERIRLELYHHYKDLLVNQQVPWAEISGPYNARIQTAIGAVDKLLTACQIQAV